MTITIQGIQREESNAAQAASAQTAASQAAVPIGKLGRRTCLLQLGALVFANSAGGQTSTVVASPAVVSTPTYVANAKLEKKQISIAAVNKTALAYLPLTVAEQLGYFAAQGLEVELTEPPSLLRAQQLASSGGGVDIVCGWLENTLRLQTKGQAFTAFVLQGRAPQIALGISTITLPSFRQLPDLRGKRVGIMAPDTPSHTIAHSVLTRAGLRAGDFSLVSVGSASGALAALRAGQIDALSYPDPVITQLELRGELRVVADTRTQRGTLQACGGDMPATCLYAAPEFVQQHPNTVQAVTYAMVHALKWLQTAGLSDLMKTVPESYFASDRALYLAAFARMRDAIALDGMISAAGVRNTLDALRGAGSVLRTDKVDIEKCFTNTFAQAAKLRYKV